MASQTKPKPVIPWKIKLLLSAYTFAVNTSRHPNGTVNRCLTTFLDLKSPPFATKPIHGVTAFDTTIDFSLNLWFRLYTPTALTSTAPLSSSYHSRTTETTLTMQRALGSEWEISALSFPAQSQGMVGLSIGEQHFIQGGIAQDLRSDGRKRLTYRPISIETGVIPQANGSARVKLGATDVIASVKAELGKPSPFQPDKGKVSIYVDCSPTAAPVFEGRGGDELSAELSTALQRCLLGGKSGTGAGIDLSSLSIVEGKICWDLYIDGLVVSSDGNLLDALGAAIKAALSNTGIPKVQVAASAPSDGQPEVDISDEEFLQFDTSGVPVIVTLTKVGRHYIVDATSEEESQMSSAISVSVNRQGRICGLTD
ncbi:Exosome complex exonuclease RRP42 [Camellia lanceoleosa]|uniref:Exosome complex exonuclease RRP42 n=1 Tax=Camellia lanceoleosa TaxID=1840588 RepID=A0ACC0H5D3_9ERIC|nr:Exosome complex exonuclease RRP42 [Camellia lanceoleosa]